MPCHFFKATLATNPTTLSSSCAGHSRGYVPPAVQRIQSGGSFLSPAPTAAAAAAPGRHCWTERDATGGRRVGGGGVDNMQPSAYLLANPLSIRSGPQSIMPASNYGGSSTPHPTNNLLGNGTVEQSPCVLFNPRPIHGRHMWPRTVTSACGVRFQEELPTGQQGLQLKHYYGEMLIFLISPTLT